MNRILKEFVYIFNLEFYLKSQYFLLELEKFSQ